jgi:predicted nucleic acid-binding Zn ribbon protein
VARRRTFLRLGELDPERLELPSARRRQLQVALSWQRVAGELIARRAPALGVRRGVLEVRVPHEGWEATLHDLIPVLAARLATQCPALGIRRVRLLGEGEGRASRSLPLPGPEERAG